MAKWFSCGSKKAGDAVAEPVAATTSEDKASASAAAAAVAVEEEETSEVVKVTPEVKPAEAAAPAEPAAAAAAAPAAAAAEEEEKKEEAAAPASPKKGGQGFFAKLTQKLAGSKASLGDAFPNQQIIFVLGQPGSGKGTQCANVGQHFGFVHISAGDLLREEVTRGSEHGKLIDEHIREGKIVPVEITLNLLKLAMEKEEHAKGFLIDGFPRQLDQADAFEATIRAPNFILYFQCSEEVLMQRLLKRGETSGRVDDNEESIKKRFKTFKDISSKCIERYSKQGKVAEIDAALDVDSVWVATEKVLVERGIARPEQAIINTEAPKEENKE